MFLKIVCKTIQNAQAMNLQKYQIAEGNHKEKKVLWIRFEYSNQLKTELRECLPYARWSQSQKAWWVKDTPYYRERLKIPSKPLTHPKISHQNQLQLNRLIEQLELKAYSKNTIKTYSGEFIQLLIHCADRDVKSLKTDDIRTYILYCINILKLTENTIHSRLNALKFYFEQVLGRQKFFMEIPRPKKRNNLPKILSKEEVIRLFKSVKNRKHLMLLKLCYGMGLRVSELAVLEIQDIDSKRMQVHIKNSKNKKDRYVNLPQSILEDLRLYYKEYKPKKYLFEGQFPDTPYSSRSIQQVFRSAMKKAGINKNIGVHGLRHSYATHLLEMGTDISLIQKLLGHNDIKTTLLYTNISDKNVSGVKSPLDQL